MIRIIGCGRSGTKYIYCILGCVGLDIGFETMNKDGMVSWNAASPFDRFGKEGTTLHQVRDPIKTISSSRILSRRSWAWIRCAIPQITEEIPIVKRSMLYWYHWNLLAQSQSEWTYQVENFFNPVIFTEFWHRVGVDPTKKQIRCMKRVSTKTNHRKNQAHKRGISENPLSKDDLIKEDEELYYKIIELSRGYGYYDKQGKQST